jgi:tRNA A-37 threonylcarbamoyl transferase component Bud32
MGTRRKASGHLQGDAEVCAQLAALGIDTVGDLLDRSTCVRDLGRRSNHVFTSDALSLHVKRSRRLPRLRRDMPREARALIRCHAAGVPTATLGVYGVDRSRGALTATFALDPARPLDELLREGVLDRDARRRALARVASLAATLHAAGLHHKDFYLNHLFMDPDDLQGAVRVIDVERVARHRRALGRWVVKDLAALLHSLPDGALTDAELTRFLVRYLERRGIPRRGVLDGLVRRVRAKAARMRAHVPRTPVGEAARPTP